MLYPKTVAIAWHAGTSHSSARAVVLYKALAAAASRDGLTILAQSPAVTPVILLQRIACLTIVAILATAGLTSNVLVQDVIRTGSSLTLSRASPPDSSPVMKE